MANIAKSHTNPLVIDATGYTPYAMKRAERSAKTGSKTSKAERQAADIRNYWVKENAFKSVKDYLHGHENDLFRSQWECKADQKGLYSRVKWEMDKINCVREKDLEQRKIKLKKMLEKEQEAYISEQQQMGAIHPTEKKAQMWQRYNDIMSQKEQKRQKLANAKKDQQFKANCDELRMAIRKNVAKMVASDGQAIVEQKNKAAKERDHEDKIYADAWIKDSEAKAQHQQEEQRRRDERNMEYGKFIRNQMSGSQVPKQEKLAVELEQQLMKEQTRLLEIEKEWEYMQKKALQERTKKDLDSGLQDKLTRKAREVRQDLMLDLHYLEQLALEDDEQEKSAAKKKALKEDQQQYLAYLSEQVKKEAAYEKTIEQKFQEENDKMWAKKEAQWKAEKRMRQALNKKMIRDIKQQISDKAELIKIDYDKEIANQSIIDQEAELEKEKEKRRKNVQNQKELLEQIKEKKQLTQEAINQRNKELAELKKEREEFDRKIEKVIADCELDYIHPYRANPDPCCCTIKDLKQ